MAAPPPDARVRRAEVVSVRPSGEDGVVLALRLSPGYPTLRAGRFFMLRREDGLSPAIPRPFSIYRQREGGVSMPILSSRMAWRYRTCPCPESRVT